MQNITFLCGIVETVHVRIEISVILFYLCTKALLPCAWQLKVGERMTQPATWPLLYQAGN